MLMFLTCVMSCCARYNYRLDVCPSVCLSHAVIVSKRLNLSSNCLCCLVAPWLSSFLRSKLFPGIPMQGVYEKVAISEQYLAIARKQLKIDGYMLRCFWPALNLLSIHVNLPRLSQGRTQGRPKCAETDARSVGDSHPSCFFLVRRSTLLFRMISIVQF